MNKEPLYTPEAQGFRLLVAEPDSGSCNVLTKIFLDLGHQIELCSDIGKLESSVCCKIYDIFLVSSNFLVKDINAMERCLQLMPAHRKFPVILLIHPDHDDLLVDLLSNPWFDDFIKCSKDKDYISSRLLMAKQQKEREYTHTKEITAERMWLETIRKASELVTQAESMDETFVDVVYCLRQIMPIDQFVIALEDDDHVLLDVIETDDNHSSTQNFMLRLPKDKACPKRFHIHGCSHIICNRSRDNDDRLTKDMRSCMCIPLYNREQQVGVVSLSSKQDRAFDEHYIPHLQSLALQVAHTISSIQRYQKARSETERLTTILREVHHRIKNNLQGVIGLLSAYKVGNPELDPILTKAVSQLHAVAEVHNLLSHRTEESIYIKELLTGICQAVAPLRPQDVEIEVVEMPDLLSISSREALPMALVINELIQNAFDHGFVDDRKGWIKISAAQDSNTLTIQVKNNGVPLNDRNRHPVDEKNYGLGLQLVRTLLPVGKACFRLYDENGCTVAEVSYDLQLLQDKVKNCCHFLDMFAG